MGMVYYLRAISAQRLSEVQEGSDAASAFLFGDLGAEAGAEPPGLVCLDKSWHAIHYLLTGAISNAVNVASVSAEDAPKLKPYMQLAEYLGSMLGQLTVEGIGSVSNTVVAGPDPMTVPVARRRTRQRP